MCNMRVGSKHPSVESVHSLFGAVGHMKDSDFLTATIGFSPTRPKPKESDTEHEESLKCGVGSKLPVRIAKKGMGTIGMVPIWRSIVHLDSLNATRTVEIPQPSLNPEVWAVTTILLQQGHIHPMSLSVLGHAMKPSARVFVIPKSYEKCSLIVNSKVGNKRDPQPQLCMFLPNMWSLRAKFIEWASDVWRTISLGMCVLLT